MIRIMCESLNIEGNDPSDKTERKIMKIQYTDGTSRITANDRETIENLIQEDIGADAVIYAGLVWADEESSVNDDGAKAVAKLWNDDGTEFIDELDNL
jgi:hypothetical protein